jgi:hypothetical protein
MTGKELTGFCLSPLFIMRKIVGAPEQQVYVLEYITFFEKAYTPLTAVAPLYMPDLTRCESLAESLIH